MLPSLLQYTGLDTINHLNHEYETPCRVAIAAALQEPEERSKEIDMVLTFLVERSGDVNLPDENGTVPLHIASAAGNEQCIRALIKHRANVHITKKDGTLSLATRRRRRRCCCCLRSCCSSFSCS
mgnify:CR=1 FL=1